MIMKLKSILLLVLSFIFINLSFGQKCKFKIDENDPFTGVSRKGNTTILNGLVTMSGKEYRPNWNFTLLRSEGAYRLELLVTLVGEMNSVVNAGESLALAFSDAQPTEFNSEVVANPVTSLNSSNTHVITTYTMTYICTKEQIQAIAEKTPLALKFKMGEQEWTMDLSAKYLQKWLNKSASCLLTLE